MPLDQHTKSFLKKLEESNLPDVLSLSLEESRQVNRRMELDNDVIYTEMLREDERRIPVEGGEITIRLYWPKVSVEKTTLPILIYYHGGGWRQCDLDTHENVCRYLCGHGGMIGINVGYRLAPEHPFPAAPEDSYTALCWVADHAAELGGDASRIVVCGDSAGGNLAAAVCQMAQDREGPAIACQVLIYPCVTIHKEADYASRRELGGGDYFIHMDMVDWLIGQYLRSPDDASDYRASPILRPDLSGLPPAIIITAEYDPIRDEAKHYADRLAGAGVAAHYKCFAGKVHAFISFGPMDPEREGLNYLVGQIGRVLAA